MRTLKQGKKLYVFKGNVIKREKGNFVLWTYCYLFTSNPAWKCLTQNNNVGPKQGYNHAKFERCCFNDVREKAKVKVGFFQMKQYVNYLPSICVIVKKGDTFLIYST